MKARKELSAAEVEQLIERLVRRLDDAAVPTLPHVAMKVLALVGDQSASVRDFAGVIQTDRALSGRLLRLANSAYFAQRKPVSTLERATVLIGVDRLKAMALGFHLSQSAAGGDANADAVKRVWTLSLFRAWLAHRLAEQTNRSIAGEAFVVALLSDAGEPLLPQILPPSPDVSAPSDPTLTPARRFHTEFHTLPFTHVDIAAALARHWRLPAMLTRPIVLHHTQPAAADLADPGQVLHAIAYLVGSLQLDTVSASATHVDRLDAAARHLLRIDRDALRAAADAAARDFAGTEDLFAHVIDNSLEPGELLARANRQLTGELERLLIRDLNSDHCGARSRRIDAGGLVFDIERSDRDRVTVYIADSEGKRLMSEEIDPMKLNADEIREMLLLDEADEADFRLVIDSINELAA